VSRKPFYKARSSKKKKSHDFFFYFVGIQETIGQDYPTDFLLMNTSGGHDFHGDGIPAGGYLWK
jgi:hypothetical protein